MLGYSWNCPPPGILARNPWHQLLQLVCSGTNTKNIWTNTNNKYEVWNRPLASNQINHIQNKSLLENTRLSMLWYIAWLFVNKLIQRNRLCSFHRIFWPWMNKACHIICHLHPPCSSTGAPPCWHPLPASCLPNCTTIDIDILPPHIHANNAQMIPHRESMSLPAATFRRRGIDVGWRWAEVNMGVVR